MTFEIGEIVELEDGSYAEVLADNGQDVDLKVVATGEHRRMSVEDLLNVEVDG